jgi:hypothetical protein
MAEFRDSAYELRVCSAIITKNVEQCRALLKDPKAEQLSAGLLSELKLTASTTEATQVMALVRMSYFAPAWLQYVAQRLVLLSPRLAHWLLRKTRLHHRWY